MKPKPINVLACGVIGSALLYSTYAWVRTSTETAPAQNTRAVRSSKSLTSRLYALTEFRVVSEGPCDGGCDGGVVRASELDAAAALMGGQTKIDPSQSLLWTQKIKPVRVVRQNMGWGESMLWVEFVEGKPDQTYLSLVPRNLADGLIQIEYRQLDQQGHP